MAKVITMIDGSPVISKSHAYGRHPNPNVDKAIILPGITHYLTENSNEYYVCDECSKPFSSPQSALSHTSFHSTGTKRKKSTTRPAKQIDTIKTLLRVVKRNAHLRSKFYVAADHLNQMGLTSIQGKPWTYHSVRHTWLKYNNVYNVRTAPNKVHNEHSDPVKQTARRRVSLPVSVNDTNNITMSPNASDIMNSIANTVSHATATLEQFKTLADNVQRSLIDIQSYAKWLESTRSVDPEIIEKAEKFDKMIEASQ